jgi:hypothetical protein
VSDTTDLPPYTATAAPAPEPVQVVIEPTRPRYQPEKRTWRGRGESGFRKGLLGGLIAAHIGLPICIVLTIVIGMIIFGVVFGIYMVQAVNPV